MSFTAIETRMDDLATQQRNQDRSITQIFARLQALEDRQQTASVPHATDATPIGPDDWFDRMSANGGCQHCPDNEDQCSWCRLDGIDRQINREGRDHHRAGIAWKRLQACQPSADYPDGIHANDASGIRRFATAAALHAYLTGDHA